MVVVAELKFAQYQEADVSRIVGGDQYVSHILTRVADTLIIDRPKYRTKAGKWRYFDSVYVNNLIYVSYEYAGVKYSLKTQVLKVSYVPFYHLCLKLPELKDIITEKLWNAPRYSGFVPVNLTARHKDGHDVLLSRRSYVVDIGRQGVGIVCEEKIARNFLLEMNVRADCRLKIKCSVKNIKTDRVDGFYYYGCKIEKVSDSRHFQEYLDFLAAATDFFEQLPTDVGTDDFSFYSFM